MSDAPQIDRVSRVCCATTTRKRTLSVSAYAIVALSIAVCLTRAPVHASEEPLPEATPARAASSTPAVPSSAAGQLQPSGSNNPGSSNPSVGQPSIPARPITEPQFRRLPIVDFVGIFTQPAYYKNNSQLPEYDPVDIGGTVRLPITRKFSLLFDRLVEGPLNQPLEAQSNNGVPILPKNSRDVVLQYHATYTFNRALSVDFGDSFRHRITNGGKSGVSTAAFPASVSSMEHHSGYLGFAYATPPLRALFGSAFVFSETLDVQNVDHHVGIACTAVLVRRHADRCRWVGTAGVIDERPGWARFVETTQGISWILPVDRRHGATLVVNERWGYLNFYENQAFAIHYASAIAYQFVKRFTPGFTLALRHTDNHEAKLGAPFPYPNVQHVGSYDVIATFHLDTNSMFH